MVASSCGPSRLQYPASLLPPTFTSRRAKTAVFCEVSPHKPPLAPLAEGRAGRGNYSPDAPAPLPVARSNFVLPPPPRGTGVGGRPGPGSALGRPPSRQRPPLGCWAWWWWLEGVEPPVTGAEWAVWAGGSRLGGGYMYAVLPNNAHSKFVLGQFDIAEAAGCIGTGPNRPQRLYNGR